MGIVAMNNLAFEGWNKEVLRAYGICLVGSLPLNQRRGGVV
jgi:hypothetical protein